MKSILTILFSFLFVVSGFSQTRNVVVDTNGVVVQPTNIWTANATNARSGLGLGATWLTNTNVTNFRSAIGLGSTNDVTFGGLTVDSGDQVVLNGTKLEFSTFGLLIEAEEQKFSEQGNDIFQWATNLITFYVPVGFSSSAIVSETKTNLGLSATWLTNTNVTNFRTAIGLGSTNAVTFGNVAATSIKYEFGGSTAIDLGDGILRNQSQSVLEFGDSNVIYVSLPIAFITNSLAATTRTNLGLGATWLTNTNVTNFRSAIGLGWSALTNSNAGTSLVSVNTNGTVVSPTNFWQVAPIQTLVQSSAPNTNSTNAATNARNLYVYSLATNIINVTNTITLPTNTSSFDGDEVTVTHRGGSNSVTAVRQLGSTNNLISLNSYDESVKFIKDGNWDFYHNISFTEAIRFSGTNAAGHAAESRTNLGLGTTNDVEFRTVKINLSTGAGDSLIVTNSSSSAVSTFDDIFVNELDAVSAAFGNTVIVSSSGISFNTNTAAAATRTNLGIPLAALTNTSATNFQKAIFYTNTAPSNIGGNLGSIAAWIEIVASNGVTYKVPAYTNIP